MDQNPWVVESIQAFYFLKCPECDFDTKEDNLFENHATKNHPLSFVLFDKKYVEEDFDTIDIKKEPLSYFDTQISYDDPKSSMNNQFPPLSSVTEKNSLLDVPELKKETVDELYLGEKQSRINEIDIKNSEIETYSTDVSHNCGICRKTFASRGHLKRHIGSVHEGKVKKKVLVTEAKKKDRFSCDLCNLSFEVKGSLTRHKKIVHEGKKAFKCHICDGDFDRKLKLERHFNLVHAKIKQVFQCKLCQKILSRPDKLKEHVQKKHSKN